MRQFQSYYGIAIVTALLAVLYNYQDAFFIRGWKLYFLCLSLAWSVIFREQKHHLEFWLGLIGLKTPRDSYDESSKSAFELDSINGLLNASVTKDKLSELEILKQIFGALKWDFTVCIVAQVVDIISNILDIDVIRQILASSFERVHLKQLILLKFVIRITSILSKNIIEHRMYIMQHKIKMSVTLAVYRKMIQSRSPQKYSGILLGDVPSMFYIPPRCLYAFRDVIQLAFAVPYIISILGKLAWIPFTAILLLVYIEGKSNDRLLFADMNNNRNARTEYLNEVFSNLRAICFNKWEKIILKKYDRHYTEKEMPLIRASAKEMVMKLFFYNVLSSIGSATAVIVSAFYSSAPLSLETVFMFQTLFAALGSATIQIPSLFQVKEEAFVHLQNLAEFLNSPKQLELPESSVNNGGLLKISQNTKFSAGSKVLSINLEAFGQLVCITGKTAAGKSSILRAFCGELEINSGPSPILNGKIAYCPQEPWIIGTSIRDNILFGSAFDSEKYNNILRVCALNEEFNDSNDQEPLVGGGKLSGGQKARISLARALYSESDIYLIDDILASLDATVTKQISKGLFGPHGLLKGKTVLLVTNKPEIINIADSIFLVESSSNDITVTQKPKSEFYEFTWTEIVPETVAPEGSTDEKGSEKLESTPDENDETEKRLPYYRWLKVAKPKYVICAVVLILFGNFAKIYASIFVNEWAEQSTEKGYTIDPSKKAPIYILLSLISPVSIAMRTAVSYLFLKDSFASALERSSLEAILFSAPPIFDSVRSGEMTNRMANVAAEAPMIISDFLSVLRDGLAVIAGLYSSALANPILVLVALFGLWIYQVVTSKSSKLITKASERSQDAGNDSASIIDAVLHGVSNIRAFGQTEYFQSVLMEKLLNETDTTLYSISASSSRSEMLSLTTFLYELAVMSFSLLAISKDKKQAIFLSIALSSVTALFENFQYSSSGFSDWQIGTAILARNEFEMNIDNHKYKNTSVKSGEIKYGHVFAKYANSKSFALEDINLTIENGQKVGIVGRTGAGKSSFVSTLFSILELMKGSIYIGGNDIKDIDPSVLKECMTIIPQDPLILTGTIRFNLDPFETLGDAQLLDILEKVHLKQFISSLAEGLDTELTPSETILSKGQIQLLCLARASLRKPKILILDEATGSLDPETESVVRNTLKTLLTDVTVLDISHRDTVFEDYDRIITLSDGKIIKDTSNKY